jgi:hypothetical protein
MSVLVCFAERHIFLNFFFDFLNSVVMVCLTFVDQIVEVEVHFLFQIM